MPRLGREGRHPRRGPGRHRGRRRLLGGAHARAGEDHQPRRRRLPDRRQRARRPGLALDPLRHDLLRRARHRPRAGHPALRRAAAGRAGRADGDAARPRPAPRGHALRGPHARHPRRAHHLRPEARQPRPGEPPQRGAPGRGHPRARRSASSRAPSAPTRCSTRPSRPTVLAELGIGGEPVATQVVARDRHAQMVCTMAVAASSLDRLATELRHLQRTELREAEEAFTVGPEGQLGDAPQAQPDHRRAHLRHRPRRARPRRRGPRGRGPLARARHLALVGGADHPPRRLPGARLHAPQEPDADGGPGRAARPHARRARQLARPGLLAARAARPGGAGPHPRAGLRAGAAQRHEGLGRGRAASATCWPTTRRSPP